MARKFLAFQCNVKLRCICEEASNIDIDIDSNKTQYRLISNFRAKSKNGGRMLREKLEKIGMTLPAGQSVSN